MSSSGPSGRLLKAQEIIRALEEELQQADHGLIALTRELEDRAERLQASEERYRRILDSIEDGYYETDRAGNLTFFNESLCRILGRPADSLIGISNREYTTEANAQKMFDSFSRVWRTGTALREVEWEIVRPDGSVRAVEASVTLIPGEDDEVIGFRGIVRDITDRRRTEEALRKSEHQLLQAQKMEAVGRLAGGVAHDFNNILTAIKGYADFVLDDLAGEAPQRADVAQIVRAADRARDLTRQLLAFSRQQVTTPRVLDLSQVIGDAEKMLRRLIGEDVMLHVTVSPDLRRVKADPTQLEQVLVNLAVNARDAMPEGGRLEIAAENVDLDEKFASRYPYDIETGSYVRLTVSDTGSGIDPAVLEKVFEPFFTTKSEGKGTGLGLSMVYGVVKQMGGYVSVESILGDGTRFLLHLPATREELEERADPALGEGDHTGSETVLLVEDQSSVRTLVSRTLRRVGYHVIEAEHGDQALSLWEEADRSIDLLLTDVVMPEMGGRELVQRLRRRHPDLRVLYMSGYAENEVARRGVLEHGTHLVEKPFGPRDLRRKVREVLDEPKRGQ